MSLHSYNDLRTLLRAAVTYQDRAGLTAYVRSETNILSLDILLLAFPPLRKKYWLAFVGLHKELVPDYVGAQDLLSELWTLFKEITLNANRYHSKVNLDNKITDFFQIVKKPLQDFDIIYEIKNLDVGETKFNLNNIELLKVTSQYLESLGFTQGDSDISDEIFNTWVRRSVAKMQVSVSDISRAFESGRARVDYVLNIMKLAAVTERLDQLFDWMFLWELGESIVIPKVKPQNGTLLSLSPDHSVHPLTFPMDKSIKKAFEYWDTWTYLLSNKPAPDIDVRLSRAMQWISHAISSSSLDHKLVDLCTALETMLLPNYRAGNKGELISIRQALVGQVISSPDGTLYSYNKRSNIVHGGFLNITSYSDYWHLLICCLQVLKNIVNLCKQHPNVTTLEELIGVVETPKSLRYFIENCEVGVYKGQGIKDIKTTAQQRIAEIEAPER